MAFRRRSRNTSTESTGVSSSVRDGASNSVSDSNNSDSGNMAANEDRNDKNKKNPYYTWW